MNIDQIITPHNNSYKQTKNRCYEKSKIRMRCISLSRIKKQAKFC